MQWKSGTEKDDLEVRIKIITLTNIAIYQGKYFIFINLSNEGGKKNEVYGYLNSHIVKTSRL